MYTPLRQAFENPKLFQASLRSGKWVHYKIWREGETCLLEIFDPGYFYPITIRVHDFTTLIPYLGRDILSPNWRFMYD